MRYPFLHRAHPLASCFGSLARRQVCPRAAAEILRTGARTISQVGMTAPHLKLVDQVFDTPDGREAADGQIPTALRARRSLLEPRFNALAAELMALAAGPGLLHDVFTYAAHEVVIDRGQEELLLHPCACDGAGTIKFVDENLDRSTFRQKFSRQI
eukprot:1946554-Rhodomonas_salina.1